MESFWNSKKFTIFGCLIISSLGAASSISSLFGDFVFDDTEVILNNADVLPETPLGQIFSHDYWGTNIRHNLSHKSYRPLTILTFRLNYILFGGLKPWTFHLVNIILHIIISILSWSVFVEVLGQDRTITGFFAALLFSVHPIHTEAVCGIVGRADLLAALLFFLSFLTYSKALNERSKPWIWVGTSMILAGISMFCKEQGVTVLGVLSAYDILSNYRVNFDQFVKTSSIFELFQPRKLQCRKSFLLRQLIVMISTFMFILIRYYIMDFQSPTFQVTDNPASFEKNWLTRVLTYNYIFCINLWLLLCPEWLCFDWSMGCIPVVHYKDIRAALVIVFWVSFAFIIWKGLSAKNTRKQRDILMSVSFLTIPFLPASNLFYRVGFVLAERVLYIPSAGFCLLIVCGVEALTKVLSFKKSDIHLGFSLLVIMFLTRSSERGAEWTTENALFNSGLKVCPLNAKVHYNVAATALKNGDVNRSISEYREAIRLFPDYYQALNNLANILKNEGNLDEAESLLRRALTIEKDFSTAWMNLGVVLAQKREYEEARSCYHNALKFRKNFPDCYYNLGKLYLEQNKLKEAEKAWTVAIKLKPKFTLAWNNLIILSSQVGNHTHAAGLGKQALKILGDEPSIHFNLGNALGKLGEFADSEKHFLKAIELKSNSPQFYANLGVLYHRWKKYWKAEHYYIKALKLNPDFKIAKENYDLLKRVLRKGVDLSGVS